MSAHPDFGDGNTYGHTDPYVPLHENLNFKMTPEERSLFYEYMSRPSDPALASGSLAVDAMSEGIEAVTMDDAMTAAAARLASEDK
jgi:hypothetical protein